jgi:hypothetical protein
MFLIDSIDSDRRPVHQRQSEPVSQLQELVSARTLAYHEREAAAKRETRAARLRSGISA